MADPHELAKNEAKLERRARLRPIVVVLAALLLLVSLAGRAGLWHWLLDLMSHFALQYLAASALLLALAWWLRTRAGALLSLAGLLLNAVLVAPLYWKPPAPEVPVALRVCSLNVQGANTRYQDTTAYLRTAPCDLLLVLEVRPEWLAALRTLAPEYRVEIAEPRSDNFGIALLSRHQPVTASMLRNPDGDTGFIDARVEVNGKTWSLLGVHPMPPMSGDITRERDQALDAIADWAARQPGPTVVIGDINLTPYSPRFTRLLSRGKLHNSQNGFGVQLSWPSKPWFLAPASIPIDHALHNAQLVTVDRSLGEANGSDHRPLLLAFGGR